INAWVDDETARRIPELLAPGVLDAMTRLLLVNAIYLKAPWQTAFAPDATRPGPFTRLDGSTIDVPTMAMQEDLPYAEGPGWRAVELPYVGGSLALTVVVPETHDGLPALEGSLDADGFSRIAAALGPQEVELTLPRFAVETKAELGDLLGALGMPLAFDPDRADFSGMTADEQLFIAH